MAPLAFFGYFFLGIGPGIVFFLFIIAPKSFLVILSMTSAFLWLLVLLITAAIFRAFVPLNYTLGSYFGLLIGALVIQELSRYALWRIHAVTTRVLDAHAALLRHRFDVIDKLYLALAWGYGHGAAHTIFFVLSFLPLTTGEGTWYLDTCPAMSIFLAGAVYSLAFGMLLPSLMVVAFEGYQERHLGHVVYAPAMHALASLLTLLNFKRNGCLAAMPLLLAIGAGNMTYAGVVCWRKGAHVPPAALQPQPSAASTDGAQEATDDDTGSGAQLVAHEHGDGNQQGNRRRRGARQAAANAQLPLMNNIA